jgi:hypothetical protein
MNSFRLTTVELGIPVVIEYSEESVLIGVAARAGVVNDI